MLQGDCSRLCQLRVYTLFVKTCLDNLLPAECFSPYLNLDQADDLNMTLILVTMRKGVWEFIAPRLFPSQYSKY